LNLGERRYFSFGLFNVRFEQADAVDELRSGEKRQ